MKTAEKCKTGFTLICGKDGVILSHLSNRDSTFKLRVGTPLIDYFDGEEKENWRTVLKWQAQGEFNLYWKGIRAEIDQVKYSCLTCVLDENQILVIGIQEEEELISLNEELLKINGQLTNRLRKMYKEYTMTEAEIYEELTKMNNELSNARRELQKKNSELEEMNDRLEEMVVRDPLTGLFNRRYFFMQEGQIAARTKRNNLPTTLVMIDVNRFKLVNDTLGHDEGDLLLQFLASCFNKIMRKGQDIVFRFGGDEFLVILERCDEEMTKIILERLVTLYEMNARGTSLAMGIIEIPPQKIQESLAEYIKKADELMYANKVKMKNTSRQ